MLLKRKKILLINSRIDVSPININIHTTVYIVIPILILSILLLIERKPSRSEAFRTFAMETERGKIWKPKLFGATSFKQYDAVHVVGKRVINEERKHAFLTIACHSMATRDE